MTRSRTVAIVGGGIQGTLCALACAAAGWQVSLYERRKALWLGASGNNEGKIHLGFTYGLDASRRTPARLAAIGHRFKSDLAGVTGRIPEDVFLAGDVVYARHVDSELDSEATDAHLLATAALADRGREAVRRFAPEEVAAVFSGQISDAWQVPELTVDPVRLGHFIGDRIAADPGIEVITGVEVARLGRDGSVFARHELLGTFDRVLNCAWDGLAALDAEAVGLCLRGKAGFIARGATTTPIFPTTLCYGPFGDVVPVGEGRFYLSWYPACLMGFTTDLAAGPRWFEAIAERFDFDAAYAETRRAFEALVPALTLAPCYDESRAGPILAAGRTDIHDRSSQLHERTVIGLGALGRVASINPGKLTTAPWWAHRAVEWLES